MHTTDETTESEADAALDHACASCTFILGALALTAAVYFLWDQVADNADSNDRRSGLARFMESIGRVPLTVIIAAIGVIALIDVVRKVHTGTRLQAATKR